MFNFIHDKNYGWYPVSTEEISGWAVEKVFLSWMGGHQTRLRKISSNTPSLSLSKQNKTIAHIDHAVDFFRNRLQEYILAEKWRSTHHVGLVLVRVWSSNWILIGSLQVKSRAEVGPKKHAQRQTPEIVLSVRLGGQKLRIFGPSLGKKP